MLEEENTWLGNVKDTDICCAALASNIYVEMHVYIVRSNISVIVTSPYLKLFDSMIMT